MPVWFGSAVGWAAKVSSKARLALCHEFCFGVVRRGAVSSGLCELPVASRKHVLHCGLAASYFNSRVSFTVVDVVFARTGTGSTRWP